MIEKATIDITNGGVRLDAALLTRFQTSTRAFIREAIESGRVQVRQGDRLRPLTVKGYKLRGGETLEVTDLLESSDNLVKPDGVCPQAIFEDDVLLAFNKPAGQPVQPLSCHEGGTLMNAVVTRYPECRPLGDIPLMAGALHRIDADTSGLVLVARSEEAFQNLRNQFSAQTVEKTYLALVEGSVAVGGTLRNDLVHDPTIPFCRMIDAHHNRLTRAQCEHLRPLPAETSYRPLAQMTVENEERTLLEVKIFTGVTHQIRAQLALAGLHIINDRLYGAFAVENMQGHALHALAAKFTHPTSGQPVEIRTALPEWAN